jgi:hypothetical protein
MLGPQRCPLSLPSVSSIIAEAHSTPALIRQTAPRVRRATNGQLALWLAACTLGASGLALVSSSPAGQEATAEAGGMSMREYQREETIDVEYSIATYQANEVMEVGAARGAGVGLRVDDRI